MLSPTPPPPDFSEAFLDWFRTTTETGWAEFQTRYFEAAGIEFGSAPWQQQACWLDGLSDDAIGEIEQCWAVRFPPDYRLFLRRLNAAARPINATPANMPPVRQPFFCWFNFYNWELDTEKLRGAFVELLEGLQFDVEHNNLWFPSWGERPAAYTAREARLAEIVALAPKLIPILGHRYLVSEPCRSGNPVLSVHQSDIVVYGVDLREYVLNEFKYFLAPQRGLPLDVSAETMARIKQIPFWGEFL